MKCPICKHEANSKCYLAWFEILALVGIAALIFCWRFL